jgi:23S rRNA (guanine745-N1)-methyltransferase
MQPLRLRAFAALRCPFCRAELDVAGGALRCPKRHSFDLARSGYVNLAVHGGRGRADGGDTRVQLQRRTSVLEAGLFDSMADAIVAGAGSLRAAVPLVLDAGCGTAHHLDRVVSRAGHPCLGLGLDISKEAAAMAARRFDGLAFAVADIWSDWPIRDGVADLVMSLFAPKNFSAAARCLRREDSSPWPTPGPITSLNCARHCRCSPCRPTSGAGIAIACRRRSPSSRTHAHGSGSRSMRLWHATWC